MLAVLCLPLALHRLQHVARRRNCRSRVDTEDYIEGALAHHHPPRIENT
jgi:hypothetical protein